MASALPIEISLGLFIELSSAENKKKVQDKSLCVFCFLMIIVKIPFGVYMKLGQ